LRALEFPELIKVLQGYARSSLGRARLAVVSPHSDHDYISARLQEVTEQGELTTVEGPCPLEKFPDLAQLLGRVKIPGSLLEPVDFNQIVRVLRLVSRVRQYFANVVDQYPLIAGRALRLQELAPVRQAIQNAISPHSLILDQASPELQRLREEMARTRQHLTRQLRQLFFQPEFKEALQDRLVAQRNGRYVILLKAECKGRVPGIIHDQSQSKATLFVEPFEVINLNNSLNLLTNEEKREQERILRQLTDLVRAHQEAIRENLAILAELDAINAKALYARDFQARAPILTHKGRVILKEARHPLLLARERGRDGLQGVVPVDLELNPQQRFLVISGANTGGKTVTLKTLGLLTLMVQCGIPIPVAEGSEICVFDHIFADIGDTQDLASNLSTFSAHIKRASAILSQIAGRCLVLLDEVGTATDPAEGGALALALLNALARAGAYGAVTTHFHLLKAFAHEQPGFVNVSVLFDEQTQKPLYRLAYGVAGPSNALKIARELGLAPEIIAEAQQYLGQEGVQAMQLLAQLESSQQDLARQRQELVQKEQSLATQMADLEAQRQVLEDEHRRRREEDRQAAVQAIKAAEAEFKQILQRLESGQQSWGPLRQELSRQQARLHQFFANSPEPSPVAEVPLQTGQEVFLSSLGREGVVMSGPDKEGRIEVLVGTVKLRMPQEDIRPARPEARTGRVFRSYPQRGVEISGTSEMTSATLNIIGLRVEEALPLVDRLLDQAVLCGCPRVDIIHGIGTGRLQKAVREHLRHHVMVKDFYPGEISQGGRGVTTVDIKD